MNVIVERFQRHKIVSDPGLAHVVLSPSETQDLRHHRRRCSCRLHPEELCHDERET